MVNVFIFSVTVMPTYIVISSICKPNAPRALKRSYILTHVSFSNPGTSTLWEAKVKWYWQKRKKNLWIQVKYAIICTSSPYISPGPTREVFFFFDLYKCFVWHLGYVWSGYSRLFFSLRKSVKPYTLWWQKTWRKISLIKAGRNFQDELYLAWKL